MDIKEIRRIKHYTQQQSADILGISRRSYQMIEKEGPKDDEQKYNYYCGLLSGDVQTSSKDTQKAPYCTNVVTGKRLEKYIEQIRGFEHRRCFKKLLDYVRGGYVGKVCVLYGLRRTGKTTLLLQLLSEIDITKTVYIKIMESNTMGDLINDINRLTDEGKKYFLIDEITLLEDFINSASALSDIYSQMGCKIVLSGTDSLGFEYAKRNELYDRTITIHTSYISYKEFREVLKIEDVDKYIEYGGTLQKENMSYDDPDSINESVSFRDDESTRKYIDTAISKNIQRTLRNDSFGANFYYLRELYDNNELTNAINRLVENMNHEFLLSVIEERFKSHDFGSAKQLLLKRANRKTQTALSKIDEKEVTTRLKKIIEIKEKEETTVKVSQNAVDQIKQYLYELELLKDVEVRYDDGTKEKVPVFTQPGMRYSIAKALCYSLMDDEYFRTLTGSDQKEIRETILSDVKGRMLEDIVLLESTYRKKEDEFVFEYKRKKAPGEIDMVIYNEAEDSFEMYEIKHSERIIPETQCRFLNDKDIVKELSSKYGKLEGKNVLYRGLAVGKEGSVYYDRVGEYLMHI